MSSAWLRSERLATCIPACVNHDSCVLVVVEPRALQLPILEAKAERLDEVQLRARVGREADHVARVRRNLRHDEHDRHHGADYAERGGKVRAITQFCTEWAPAALSVRASSCSDAPVVITSSTTAMSRPRTSSSHTNTPRTLAARSLQASTVCGAASLARPTR